MASIHKHRDKYQVRVRRKGLPTITKTFRKLFDAKEWATLQERQADRGEFGPDRKVLETITLDELVTRYRDTVLPGKKGGSVETIMLTAFLQHPICKKPRFKLKVIDNKRQRRLRKGELDRLLEAGKKTRNPLIVPIIMFALETAMRRGEILALRVRDVDLERHSATVRESKNGYSRTIPLSSAAVTLLTDAIACMGNDEKAKNGRLFPITPIALRLAWDRLTRRAEIEDLNFHDLRHEAISRLFELGLTVPEVASISGHRDMRMLFRHAHANHASIRAKLAAADQPLQIAAG